MFSTVDKVIGLTFGLLFAMWFLSKPNETVTIANGVAQAYATGVGALTPR